MVDNGDAMRALFTRYVASQTADTAAGAVAELIADNDLSHESFDRVLVAYGVRDSAHFRAALLDLILHATRACLREHCLSTDEYAFLRGLKAVFHVEPGEFYKYRRNEVSTLLCGELHRMLADDVIDGPEALLQVELQALFDLGYDEYLELTRTEVSRVVDRAIARITADGTVTAEERRWFTRQLTALDTAYRFSHAQRRALQHAGFFDQGT